MWYSNGVQFEVFGFPASTVMSKGVILEFTFNPDLLFFFQTTVAIADSAEYYDAEFRAQQYALFLCCFFQVKFRT